jgi:hypothetical protein
VEVIATLKKSGQPTQLILVRQFRPPTGTPLVPRAITTPPARVN